MQAKFRHAAILLGSAIFLTVSASAQNAPQSMTLDQALANAYFANPNLNVKRAAVRVTDEYVPQALAGYRPKVQGSAEYGIDRNETQTPAGRKQSLLNQRGYGITAQQNVFNGFQTGNLTRAAESQVLAAREDLRLTEQDVLLDAVSSYVGVLTTNAIVSLQKGNLDALNEQLRATRDRFNVGELTRTDVAQSQARVAQAESSLAGAIRDYNAARAAFRRDIGVEPGNLAQVRPYEKFGVATLDAALAEAFGRHPAIMASRYGVDVASLNVRVAQGALLPTINLEASTQRFSDPQAGLDNTFDASAGIRLTVPLYQGGADHSKIRQNKEIVGQRQLESDVTRDKVRAVVISSWSRVSAAKSQIEAAQSQVTAADIALKGVLEEYRVGQRTTIDTLNAQFELVQARVALVQAQGERVNASYTMLYALGHLSLAQLGIAAQAQTYQPEVHYEQVRDQWFGLRTPDGK